jgi:tetratricopeptide (TPR) repeat protein
MPRAKTISPATTPFPWWIAIALFVLTVATYIPSMLNGFIWDDPQYVVDNPTLKSAEGLWSIWTDPWATPQYYPMVHSTFWVEAQIWGTQNAAGFHVDNILLHALAVVLLWRLLASFEIPCAWLAAAIFAVHPVMVESVSWVTERKNVLSIVFYLMAFRAYRKSGGFGQAERSQHSPRYWYFASLGLFLLALWSKTVTCSLPAAILLVLWWKRGRITWADIKPLIPMFAIGLLLSAFTGHLERTHVGARGPDFNWSIIDRGLIAGHAICFYALKLVWPHPLIFMYPKWDLHAPGGSQFIYPAIAFIVPITLLLLRRLIGRGPLAAVLFFIGTLTPALGFVNVYPMRYSFVADHFQYLASIGLITLFAAAFAKLKRRLQFTPALSLVPLIWLTVRQQLIYKDQETLWNNTIAQNPACWMAHINLAGVYQRAGRLDEAMNQSELALKTAPNEADTQYDMGVAMAFRKNWEQAEQRFRNAVQIDPQCSYAWSDLSLVLWQHIGTPEAQAEAVQAANTAIEINPHLSSAHFVRGCYAELRNDLKAAIDEYHQALTIDPDNIPAHSNLGRCLLNTGDPADAAGEYLKVLAHNKNDPATLTNLGNAVLMAGHPREAAGYFQQALAVDPGWKAAREGLDRARK